jgi:hypothetical protein
MNYGTLLGRGPLYFTNRSISCDLLPLTFKFKDFKKNFNNGIGYFLQIVINSSVEAEVASIVLIVSALGLVLDMDLVLVLETIVSCSLQ